MQKNKKVFIIAEAGVNHNGSVEIAKKMVDIAVEAGADAVKFQTFKTERVTSKFAPKAEYQKRSTDKKEYQFDMLKKLELNINAHRELISYCKKKDIIFLSSPFDLESIDLLNGLGVKIFKIPSGKITNVPYLRKIGSLRKKVIMSTGMADLKEIKDALNILIMSGTQKKNITILHCNTEYPTPVEDVNLLAMLTIRDTFKVNVGYSDHTLGIEIPVLAGALGAKCIEKHFTLHRNMKGPDHRASLEPQELEAMVKAIRNIGKAFGNEIKKASPSELKNKMIIRESIVASKNITKGKILNEENITTKRPAKGISPMKWDNVIGRPAKKNFKEDELIEL
ncbi:MAG: N-acetylneuraminate synthase [Candidatus Omnitrophica bacterium]|nr:N-acetylneuraminate synthase [Candidatus Omnitrophota bacterium]